MQAVLPPNQNELYSSQILLFTAIWLMRIRMKEFITRMNWSTSSNPLQGSAYIQAIADTFSIEPPEIEVNYLSFIIESLNFKYLSNSIEWAHAQLLSLQLIQFVECQTKIP
ncbi:transcription antiterminator BglG, partial [Escherichia coli]